MESRAARLGIFNAFLDSGGEAGWSRRLPAVFVVFVLMAAVIVMASLVGVKRRVVEVRAQETEEMQAVLGLKVAQWRLWMEERHGDVQGLRTSQDLLELPALRSQVSDAVTRASIVSRLQNLRQAAQSMDVLLIDASGRVAAHAAAGEVRRNPALVGEARRALAQQDLQHGALFTDSSDGGSSLVMIDMLLPLPRTVYGEPALLVMRFDVRPVAQRILQAWNGHEGVTQVVMLMSEGNGLREIAAGSGSSGLRATRAPVDSPAGWAAQVQSDGPAVGRAVDGVRADGSPVLAVAIDLPDAGSRLAMVIDKQKLFAQTWADAIWVALADVFALVLAGGAAYVMVQRRALQGERRERLQQDEKLRTMHLLDAVANGTPDAVYAKDRAGRYIFMNRFAATLIGRAQEDVLGRTDLELFGHEIADGIVGMDRQVLETETTMSKEEDLALAGEGRRIFHTVKSPLRDANGQVIGVCGVSRDISERKISEQQLDHLAHYDALTDLPNRRLVQLRLEHALERTRRHQCRIAILFIDLDGFKTVNDSLGHPAGDELLRIVAKRLRACLRSEDTLGRLGGDEFLVVLESLDEASSAATVARNLLMSVAEPVRLDSGAEAYVTASIGISVSPADGSANAVEMLRDADAAMYRAKDEGRNRFCFFTPELNAEATSKLELEAALSRALERNEFVLHYQPQVSARTGRVVGVEALIRWNRQGQGMVAPGSFIPLAERSSLILAIGSWVIETACRQIRAWMDAGQPVPRVAVNVSARQFAADDLDVVIDQALRRNHVPPARLEVELTESMLAEDPLKTEKMLRRLKAIGVTLALDDFGTGYSSLGYLHRFPIDIVKIDQSFVRRIGEGPDGASIADAIIALAQRLKLRVIAEGVETPAQRDHLREQGCNEFQGYLFGRPMAAEALQALLREAQPSPEDSTLTALT